ncbi:MAG: thioesterase family protein [Betaproteobacteria bacterium]|nr:thioesterase family protein [Betaproteobacteria bacterium]
MAFTTQHTVTWAQLDSNGHMANTAYLDTVVDTRFAYFASQGFPPAAFAKHQLGPVVRRDEVEYFKELRLQQAYTVNFRIAGLSEDGSRFRIVNEIQRDDGQPCARVTTLGGWFDLAARKLVAPPAGLAAALQALEKTEDFEVLPGSA